MPRVSPSKTENISSLSEEFISKLRDEVSKGDTSLANKASAWMCKFIAHPVELGKLWSFKDHEYQIDIVDDKAPKKSVKKCSQVGLSELSVNLSLFNVLSKSKTRVIYTLPTTTFANMFCADRINGVIESSSILSSSIDPNLDNLSVKKFSNRSFLYVAGTESEKGAISIPCPTIFKDEIDFSNQKILSRLASRQAHWKEEDIQDISFSTPTIPDFGIEELYSTSSKGLYGVKCDSCRKWVTPLFLEHVRIPNFNDPISEFSASDLQDTRYKVEEAYVSCPKCSNPLSPENMLNPEKRQWIHEISEKVGKHNGYWVQPFDVYSINPPSRTLMQIGDYESKQEWVNFRIGNSYIDASVVLPPPQKISREPSAKGKYYIGVDVGKITWLTLGKVVDGVLYIIKKEKIINKVNPLTYESSVIARVKELKATYNIERMVCDAMPDLTLSSLVQTLFKSGYIARYTTKSPEVGKITLFKDNNEVGIFRTEAFNRLSSLLATGRIKEVPDEQTSVFKSHLQSMYKIYEKGVARWTNRTDDHYAHSCIYLASAAGMFELGKGNTVSSVFSGGLTTASIGSKVKPKKPFNMIPKVF